VLHTTFDTTEYYANGTKGISNTDELIDYIKQHPGSSVWIVLGDGKGCKIWEGRANRFIYQDNVVCEEQETPLYNPQSQEPSNTLIQGEIK